MADYFLFTVPHKIHRKEIQKFRKHKLGKIGVFEAKELVSLKHLGNNKNTSFRSLETLTKKPTCPLDIKKSNMAKCLPSSCLIGIQRSGRYRKFSRLQKQ